MRRSLTTRVGALGLSLLLQVFVLSGLLHPCCLGESGMAGGAHHGSSHVEQGPANSAAAALTPAATGHAATVHAAAHGGAPDHAASALGILEGPTAQDGGHGDAQAPHADSGSDHDNGCDGECGLCCSTVDSVGLPAAPMARTASAVAAPVSVLPAPEASPRSQPRFILPFANGPPTTASHSV